MSVNSVPISAGPKLRAGLTEAPLIGIAATWIATSASGIASRAVPRARSLFDDCRITATKSAVNTNSTTIPAQLSPDCVDRAGHGVVVERDQHDQRRRDRAHELRDDVADQVVHREAPVEEHRERDGGVEVATRDLAECVEADEQGEAEPERDRHDPESVAGRTRR